MSQYFGNALPGIQGPYTATPRRILLTDNGAMYYPGGVVIDGTKTRDTGNTGNLNVIRCGMPMGKITSGGLWANSFMGALGEAYASGTTITIPAAVAVELVRRVGATGTFKLTGPPVAAGTVRTMTLTYSAVNQTTGAVTITNPSASSTWTITEADGTDGGTFRIKVTTPDGVSDTTTDLAYNITNTDMDTALEALANVGAAGVAATGSAGGPYTLTFAAALGDVQIEIINDSTTDGTVWEGGVVIAQTVVGVDARFIVGSFVQPTDGSESPRALQGSVYGIVVTDIYLNNVSAQEPSLLVAGAIITANIIFWPADTSLRAWLIATLKSYNFGFLAQSDFIA